MNLISVLSILLSAVISVSFAVTTSSAFEFDNEHQLETIEKRQGGAAAAAQVVSSTEDLASALINYETARVQSQTVSAILKANEPGKTGVQLVQEALNDVKQRTGQSSVAVRFGIVNVPTWNGSPVQDYGLNFISMTGSDGLSVWNYYWVKSGHIVVLSSNLANDVAIGGAYSTARDPTNPNSWTIMITIIPSP